MKQISRNSLSAQVAELIQQKIQREKLRSGDVLGTELKFAEEFGVSRNIIREAIGRLRALGIVEGKQKTGLVVGQTDPVELFEQGLSLFLMDEPINLEELAKFRYVLELGAVDLAVRNITEKQIEKMKQISEQMAEMHKLGKDKETNILEEQFHSLILQSSGSQLLARMHVVVSRYFAEASSQIDNYDPITPEGVKEHQEIANAFEKKDANMIRSLLKKHLSVTLNIDN